MLAASQGSSSDPVRFSMASDIVELVVFTSDEAFMLTLREAVGSARRLWHVPSADQVSDMLLAGQVGILVLDIQSHPDAAGAFVAQIKRQFPDLVIVVAGNRDAESSLAKLISDGVVYRFIHKPMSPARAKLFVDAAVKRYGDRKRTAVAEPRSPHAPDRRRGGLIALGAAAALLVALMAAWALRRGSDPHPELRAAHVEIPGMAAEVAAAPTGLPESRERLLAQAETALLHERIDEAATAIEAARRAGVDGGRITFLASQLQKLRTQKTLDLARVRGEARPGTAAAPAQTAGDGTGIKRLLELAAERIKEDRLIEPAEDSARFYVHQAMQADPNGNASQAAQETLAHALLAQTHAAIDRREFARASLLLDAASGIAAPTNVDNAREQLLAARAQADAERADELLKSAQERLQKDRLIEPAGDSAKHYLAELRALAPKNPGLAPAVQDFGTRAVAHARHATDLQQFDIARSWLDEATAAGYAAPDATAALQDLTAASARQQFLSHPIDASQLTVVKSVTPSYPTEATRAGTEGWVELDFTISEAGDVQDIALHASNPPGVFDAAAMGALSRWRYAPVLRDAKPVPQRARIRIRFTLKG